MTSMRATVVASCLLCACGQGNAPTPGTAGDMPDAAAGAQDARPAVDVTSAPGDAAAPDRSIPDAAADQAAAVPIATPMGTWTWIPIADSYCGNGTPAGIGVNLAAGEGQLLFYLQGGGACWDALTCYGLKASVRVEEAYTAATFASEVPGLVASGVFDRADASNPFRDASFVYVPYCTGDLHVGDAIRSYDALAPQRKLFHKGAANMSAFLRRLAAAFPNAGTVWLAGSSAGGYGVTFNLGRVAAAFPTAQVHVLGDCAPFITPGAGRWPAMRDAWQAQLPTGCAACTGALQPIVDHFAAAHPGSRIALLAYERDGVIGSYFAYGAAEMAAQTNQLLASQYKHANTRYFVLPGTSHVMLDRYKSLAGPGGVTLRAWITVWATGQPAWPSVR